MIFSKFRENAYQKLKRKNFEELKAQFESSIPKKLLIKIENYINRNRFFYGEKYKINDHIEKFKKVPVEFQYEFLYPFIKDPSKQTMDETLQIDFFLQKQKIKIEKLPQKGLAFDKEKYMIIDISEKSVKSRTKTFDGIIPPNCYIFLKYIGENGGAQDNQVKDIIEMITCADRYITTYGGFEFKFLTIIDGPYGISKIPKIKEFISDKNKDRIFIMTSDEELPLPIDKLNQK